MNKTWLSLVGMGCLGLIVAGCGAVVQDGQSTFNERGIVQMETEQEMEDIAPREASSLIEAETSVIEPKAGAAPPPATLPDTPQPVNELADGEYTWSQLLTRDAIAPIYDPQFAPASQAPYDDNELVIGVEINNEAKAYAIGPLNSREMVNDTVGGVPVLVTW